MYSLKLVLLIVLIFDSLNLSHAEQSLQSAYFGTFKIYQKAINLAHTRELTTIQNEELRSILEEQPNIIYKTLRENVEINGQIQTNPNGENIGFVFLNGPLNQSQIKTIDKALIQHQLHFTKQIVLCLNLTGKD